MTFPIGLSGVTAGMMALSLILGIATVAVTLLNWRDFQGSTYGNAFLVFAVGWAVVEAHTARELVFSLSGGTEFPTFMAASLATTGVLIVSASFYLIYRESK